eukprot:jgi/Undpi1/7881/HiC_scaffold_24.g10353.m1
MPAIKPVSWQRALSLKLRHASAPITSCLRSHALGAGARVSSGEQHDAARCHGFGRFNCSGRKQQEMEMGGSRRPRMLFSGALPAEFGFGVVNALVMVITLQASGNLVNSYIDHDYGVDTLETAGDRTIVDAHVSPRGALMLAGVLLVAAVSAVLPTIVRLRATGAAKDLETTFWVGVGMVFSYSCWPFRLKYRGLGDITVFLLFGPMLMQVAALLMSGEVQHWVLPYGVPAALLCEAILHANNIRDIGQDSRAGISTLATTYGVGGDSVGGEGSGCVRRGDGVSVGGATMLIMLLCPSVSSSGGGRGGGDVGGGGSGGGSGGGGGE